MSSAAEARHLIEDIIGPVPIGTKLKAVLPFVADMTGLTERRIRGLWNMEAKALRAEELIALRRAQEDAIHERNLQTRHRLACRSSALAMEGEDCGV